METIWDRYPDLSPGELRTLVATTAQVLADSADAALPADPIEMSTGEAARALTASLDGLEPDAVEDVQELLEDAESATDLCCAVLDQVRAHPDLASAVSAAYEERTRKMAGFEMLLLAGALVVLAIKIKEVRVGKNGVKVSFSESSEAVQAFVSGLVSGLKG